MTTITSSTGGTIITSASGLIHHSKPDRQATETAKFLANGAPKFDFSAFLNSVKLTAKTGRIIKFK